MGAISRETLAIMLCDHFEETYSRVTKHWRRQLVNMSEEIDHLCQTFGQRAVMARFTHDFGVPFSGILEKLSGKLSKQVRRLAPKSGAKKARRTQRRCLSYSELRPHVIDVIKKSFGSGATFNTREVQTRLQKSGILFKRKHMTVIIFRDIVGLEKVGTTQRVGRTQPTNIYKVIGPIGLGSGVRRG